MKSLVSRKFGQETGRQLQMAPRAVRVPSCQSQIRFPASPTAPPWDRAWTTYSALFCTCYRAVVQCSPAIRRYCLRVCALLEFRSFR